MNFDEAYKHVREGCASEEEKQFVEQEIKQLRLIKDLLDSVPSEPVVSKADSDVVIKARKTFHRKTAFRISAIVIGILLSIAILVCGIIFIPSCSSASKCRNISRDEAVELALAYLEEHGENTSGLIIDDLDTHLRIIGKLNNATYVYEIDLENEFVEYELEVSAKSGFVVLKDVNR